MSIKTNSSEMAVEITYDISSYGKYKGYGDKVILNIKYTLFDNIEEIEEQI